MASLQNTLSVSIVPGEIIPQGSTIQLRAPCSVYPVSARGNIGLFQNRKPLRAPLTLEENDTVLNLSTKGLGPGSFILRVGEVLDTHGKLISTPSIIPVTIGALAGRVSPDLRIEHAVHLAVGETLLRRLRPGERLPEGHKYIELVKAVHRESGSPVNIAFDERGEKIDGDEEIAKVGRARLKKFGKIHENLFYQLHGAPDDKRVDVVVWPRIDIDLTGYAKPTNAEIKEPPQAEVELRQKLDHARHALVETLKRHRVAIPQNDIHAPAIHVSLSVSQIRSLAASEEVGIVFFDEKNTTVTLKNSIAIARSDRAQRRGYTGSGVNVAVYENGPSDTRYLQFAGRYLASPTNDPNVPWHSRLTSAVVKNAGPGEPNGHAPNCNLYSANSTDPAALRWALQSPQTCTVISQSFYWGSTPPAAGEGTSSTADSHDILADYLATTWPFPTIVQSAGNDALVGGYVAPKGYNVVSVGNHDDDALFMASDSSFKNPASTAGDRELPTIAANGTAVTSIGLTGSGTSFAAPATAGVVALMQSVNGILKSWPEACRAILFASANRNVSGSDWSTDLYNHIDASDGAGALEANYAVQIAENPAPPGSAVSAQGWFADNLVSSSIGSDRLATFSFKAGVPAGPEGPIFFHNLYTFKAALAWNSKLTTDASGNPLTSALTVDLDLIVRDSKGAQVAVAASYDNSYEIVEFPCVKGEVYDIIIRRWAGTDSVWYGIAWNITSLFDSFF
jgi:hypothetical protein